MGGWSDDEKARVRERDVAYNLGVHSCDAEIAALKARAEKAEAALAEMRAAGRVAHEHACKMAEFHGPRCEEHERHDEAPDDCLRCAADTAFSLAFAELRKTLSRPDLGRGDALLSKKGGE